MNTFERYFGSIAMACITVAILLIAVLSFNQGSFKLGVQLTTIAFGTAVVAAALFAIECCCTYKTCAAPVHQEIKLMAQGVTDYEVDAFPIRSEKHGVMLTIGAEEGAIYVTKAQAMEFFGLVPFKG